MLNKTGINIYCYIEFKSVSFSILKTVKKQTDIMQDRFLDIPDANNCTCDLTWGITVKVASGFFIPSESM